QTAATRQLIAQALEALTRAVDLDPQSVRVHLILAESLGDSGKFLDSVQEYEKVLSLHPDSVAANLGLATVRWKSGETESALQPLRRVLELSPNDPEATASWPISWPAKAITKPRSGTPKWPWPATLSCRMCALC